MTMSQVHLSNVVSNSTSLAISKLSEEQPPKLDQEVPLHLNLSGEQDNPTATVAKGGFGIVVWVNTPRAGFSSLYGRKIHPNGSPVGREVELKIDSPMTHKYSPNIIYHDSGFVAAWEENMRFKLIKLGIFDLDFNMIPNTYTTITPPPPENTSDYASWGHPLVAQSKDGSFGVVFSGQDSLGHEPGLYFRGLEASGTPWNEMVKINSDDHSISFDKNYSIAAVDYNSFIIVYSARASNKENIYITKVNYLGQVQLRPTLIATAPAETNLQAPCVSVSKMPNAEYVGIAWTLYHNNGRDHHIQYQIFHPQLTPSSQLQTIPQKSNLTKAIIRADPDAYRFAIGYAVKSSGADQIALYKIDFSGIKVAEQQISSLELHLKLDPTLITLSYSNYFAAWTARNYFGENRDANIFGLNFWPKSAEESVANQHNLSQFRARL